jgi:hypothetical protein
VLASGLVLVRVLARMVRLLVWVRVLIAGAGAGVTAAGEGERADGLVSDTQAGLLSCMASCWPCVHGQLSCVQLCRQHMSPARFVIALSTCA